MGCSEMMQRNWAAHGRLACIFMHQIFCRNTRYGQQPPTKPSIKRVPQNHEDLHCLRCPSSSGVATQQVSRNRPEMSEPIWTRSIPEFGRYSGVQQVYSDGSPFCSGDSPPACSSGGGTAGQVGGNVAVLVQPSLNCGQINNWYLVGVGPQNWLPAITNRTHRDL